MRRILWITWALLIAGVSVGLNAESTGLSEAALKSLTPEGYKVEKTLDCGQREVLVALSGAETEGITARPVTFLLVAVGKRIAVEDRVIPHDSGKVGFFWDGPPNYFAGMTRENVGGSDLVLLKTVLSGGASDSLHYFDFYRVEQHKLRLVKSLSHGRMERTYFALYKNAIYDAEKVCTRGEKHGKTFVYTCYLQVTKYAFDGQTINPAGSERMREQQGNRFLDEKYRFMSVLKALQKNEIFAAH